MATRVELPRELIYKAIETHQRTLERAVNKYATNPIIHEQLTKEIQVYKNANATLADTK